MQNQLRSAPKNLLCVNREEKEPENEDLCVKENEDEEESEQFCGKSGEFSQAFIPATEINEAVAMEHSIQEESLEVDALAAAATAVEGDLLGGTDDTVNFEHNVFEPQVLLDHAFSSADPVPAFVDGLMAGFPLNIPVLACSSHYKSVRVAWATIVPPSFMPFTKPTLLDRRLPTKVVSMPPAVLFSQSGEMKFLSLSLNAIHVQAQSVYLNSNRIRNFDPGGGGAVALTFRSRVSQSISPLSFSLQSPRFTTPPEPPDRFVVPTPSLYLFTAQSLIIFYSLCGNSTYAHHLFEEMPERGAGHPSIMNVSFFPYNHAACYTKEPFNAEPQRSALVSSYLTPADFFYKRNHGPVPIVDDIERYCVSISGLIENSKQIFRNDIWMLPKYNVTATLQCAGNRRTAMSKTRTVKGVGWDVSAIGNALWGGAKLTDVLELVGVSKLTSTTKLGGKHVEFVSIDQCKEENGGPYKASIPLIQATNPELDVLLAWLEAINIISEECQGFFMQKDYKMFPPSINWENINWSTRRPQMDFPVQCVICSLEDIATIKPGKVKISGYAASGGGRGIERVDVSIDGGETWIEASRLQKSGIPYIADDDDKSDKWAWVLFEVTAEILHNTQIIAKAVDSAGNVQPEKVEDIWNLRGILKTSWHRIQVQVAAHLSSQRSKLVLNRFAFVAIFHRKMIYKGSVLAQRILLKWKTLPLQHGTCEYSSLRTRMF